MKLKTLAILAILTSFLTVTFAYSETDNKSSEPFKWYNYNEGLKFAAKKHKFLMIDFYTDWCGYCKKMDKLTYTDSTVAKYIRDHFVPIKVNAESREAMEVPTGQGTGVGLARSYGVTAYPNIWFLDSKGQKLNNIPGYAPPEKFIHVLRYFAEGAYKSQSFQDYYAKASSLKN
jgi:thioredoxin-related protein